MRLVWTLRLILQMESARRLRISATWHRQAHTYMEDLNEAGGVYAVMNELDKIGLLHKDCMTVTGKTVGENIEACSEPESGSYPSG